MSHDMLRDPFLSTLKEPPVNSLAGRWISTVDYHTAGEPFRIVTEGYEIPAGDTVGARRVGAIANEGGIDDLRELLCFEPRGHADMYGGFIMPADDSGAHFGVLFWHKDGFSTACGHGTIALGVWATDTGLVESNPDGVTEVRIDVPSGRVSAFIERSGGSLVRATFRNVTSHVVARGIEVETSRGKISADLSFSGAIYASVRAADLGLSVGPEHYTELIALGREIKWALNESPEAQHAADPRLSGIYGTILYDDLGRHEGDSGSGPQQRNVTVFADGEVDRSPCGSGTGARVTLLADGGTLGPNEVLVHRSITETEFRARWTAGDPLANGTATVIPQVEGTAYQTGEHRFILDPADAVGTGFVLR